jgi:hypothetical protein
MGSKLVGFFLIIWLFAGCIDENIFNVSTDIEITSGYSLPLGNVDYNINNYLEALDSINYPWPDSLYYNDTLYPNYLPFLDERDVKEFDFSRLSENLDLLEAVMFRLIIDNVYPTPALSQVYFTDGVFNYIDSAFADGPRLIPPAETNADGMVTEAYHEVVDITMSDTFLDNMENIRNIIIVSRIYTTRPDVRYVKFYSQYEFSVHIGTRIRLRYNTGEIM